MAGEIISGAAASLVAPSVLGLDLATRATGWTVGDVGSTSPSFGTFNMPPTGEDIGLMLCLYEDWLRAKIDLHRPTKVVFEAPILSQRTMTARKLMGLAGETERVCRRLGVPCEEVSLSSVKLFFAGHGHAEKKHMIARAHDLGWEVQNDNEADGCGIWLFGCATIDRKLQSFAAPKIFLPPKPRKIRKSRKGTKRGTIEAIPL
jgi:Holliday junction resolvasome RuvABC endonuclease subunit